MKHFEFHPLAKIFPLIEGAPFDELVSDIKENGLREPITLMEGAILDGRNRYRACGAAGVDIQTVDFVGDPLKFVISKNLRRRNLKDGQRALIAAELANLPQGHRNTKTAKSYISQTEAAQLLNVSERSLRWGRQALAHGIPEIRTLVEAGRLSVSAAGKVARLNVEKQRIFVSRGTSAIVAEARRLDHRKGRQGRSEHAILWRHVDQLCDAIEASRMDLARSCASKLVQEIDRIVKSRRAA